MSPALQQVLLNDSDYDDEEKVLRTPSGSRPFCTYLSQPTRLTPCSQ